MAVTSETLLLDLVKVLMRFGAAPSISEAKRMIRSGQVKLIAPEAKTREDAETVTDRYLRLSDDLEARIRAGQRIIMQGIEPLPRGRK